MRTVCANDVWLTARGKIEIDSKIANCLNRTGFLLM
jgi:hypothetical protein